MGRNVLNPVKRQAFRATDADLPHLKRFGAAVALLWQKLPDAERNRLLDQAVNVSVGDDVPFIDADDMNARIRLEIWISDRAEPRGTPHFDYEEAAAKTRFARRTLRGNERAILDAEDRLGRYGHRPRFE